MKAVAVVIASIFLLSGGFIASIVDAEDTYCLDMTVGDVFSYTPETNLPCQFTVFGDGVIGDDDASEGAFLTYEDGTVSGEALVEGTFHVTIRAVWTCPEDESLTQTICQFITLTVYPTIGQNEPNHEFALSNQNGWALTATPTANKMPASMILDAEAEDSMVGTTIDHEEVAFIALMIGILTLVIGAGRLHR